MKRKLYYIIPAIALFITGCSAQKKQAVKVYAYSQVVIPGIIPSGIDENGNKVRKEYTPKKNYMIYVETLKNKPVTISDLWIDSLHYTVKTERINTTPVNKLRYNEYDKTDTVLLVPKTGNNVVMVLPGDLSEKLIPNAVSSDTGEYPELTIGYIYKGKKYFAEVKKFTVVPPDITQ